MDKKGSSRISPMWVISVSQWMIVMGWFNFSAVMPSVQQDLLLSSAQSGIILSTFQFGYLLSVLVSGNLADRTSLPKEAKFLEFT